MEQNRKNWNENQARLRQLLSKPDQHQQAVALFLRQHAALHSRSISPNLEWSYEDEILDDLTDSGWRRIPASEEHSILWCIWHLARIEDVTMNILLAGTSQVLNEGWYERMNVPLRDTGNLISPQSMQILNQKMDPAVLRGYRQAVGLRTRDLVSRLQPEAVKRKVDAARLGRILDEQALDPAAQDVLAYWGGLTIAGLLLMPPTRHNLIHLNEAARIKSRPSPKS
jgi:hypothetical protein